MRIKNKDDFWNAIIGDSTNNVEILYKVLCARGFFLEFKDGTIYVLDNNHVDDFDYLDSLLKKCNIGYVKIVNEKSREANIVSRQNGYHNYVVHTIKDGLIVIENEKNIDKINEFIQEAIVTDQIGYCCCWGGAHSWWYFLDRINGPKVPVKELETYISRFIRALTSCGLETAVSCDGNHKRLAHKVWLGFDSEANDMYYDAICNYVLNDRFNYRFSKRMPLNKDNQYKLYYKLNCAANFLFENRKFFRDLKDKFYNRYEFKYLYNDNNGNAISEDFNKYLNEEVKWEVKYA